MLFDVVRVLADRMVVLVQLCSIEVTYRLSTDLLNKTLKHETTVRLMLLRSPSFCVYSSIIQFRLRPRR